MAVQTMNMSEGTQCFLNYLAEVHVDARKHWSLYIKLEKRQSSYRQICHVSTHKINVIQCVLHNSCNSQQMVYNIP